MKRKSIFKRGGIFVLSAIMALTMCSASAFAASIGNGVATTTDTQITVPKGVTFINEDAVTSYGPGIEFTYTVGPATVADGSMTVTDSNGNSTTVHSGPADGLTLAANSVAFTSAETFTTSASGVEATKDITLNVDTSKFSRAGVYRYVLTDTTATSALYQAGITRANDYDTTRYIDVFIKRGTNGAMEVYGYALKTENSTTTANSQKDPGFVSGSPAEGANTDKYATYNVTLTKQVAGTLGDTEHEFPFAITVANNGKSYFAGEGTTAVTSATSLSATLKHGETYTIQGLNPHATVAYRETNDTTDLYEVTAAGASSALTVTADANAKTYDVAAGAVSTYDTANSNTAVATVGAKTNYESVTYTNTLDEVSPTGLVLRFGAYAFLIAAAFALIAFYRKKESVVDEI